MSALRKITLHLARQKGFPEGSARHGYTIVAPLTDEGRIDAEAWKDQRTACIVHRFWADEPPMRGVLVHRAGGVGGATWSIDYDKQSTDDDEDGFRFGDHLFRPGDYVSIREPGGEMNTFRVMAVSAP
jgi:hypothetical protein